eukprot:1138014-Pelagomonas_calceolata.AAC.6
MWKGRIISTQLALTHQRVRLLYYSSCPVSHGSCGTAAQDDPNFAAVGQRVRLLYYSSRPVSHGSCGTSAQNDPNIAAVDHMPVAATA